MGVGEVVQLVVEDEGEKELGELVTTSHSVRGDLVHQVVVLEKELFLFYCGGGEGGLEGFERGGLLKVGRVNILRDDQKVEQIQSLPRGNGVIKLLPVQDMAALNPVITDPHQFLFDVCDLLQRVGKGSADFNGDSFELGQISEEIKSGGVSGEAVIDDSACNDQILHTGYMFDGDDIAFAPDSLGVPVFNLLALFVDSDVGEEQSRAKT